MTDNDKKKPAQSAKLEAGLTGNFEGESTETNLSHRKGDEHHTEEYETGLFRIPTRAKGKRTFKGTVEERAEKTRYNKSVIKVSVLIAVLLGVVIVGVIIRHYLKQ